MDSNLHLLFKYNDLNMLLANMELAMNLEKSCSTHIFLCRIFNENASRFSNLFIC